MILMDNASVYEIFSCQNKYVRSVNAFNNIMMFLFIAGENFIIGEL